MISGEKLDRAMELHNQGWSYTAIGREFGVSRAAATNAIKRQLVAVCSTLAG